MKLGRLRFGPLHFLLILILLLAGGLAAMWFDKHGKMRNVTWIAPSALRPDITTPKQATATASAPAVYAAILERPVFAPDRRPVPPPTVAPPDPLANIQIMGIFSGTNAGILARVDGKVRRIKVNEMIGPWNLKSIDGRAATFTQGEENRQLNLAYARLDTLTTQAAPSATRTPVNTAQDAAVITQNHQDESRERLRRRNEIRAARGLPLVTE